MSSSPLRQLREDDAEQVAALFVAEFGDARLIDAEEIRSWVRNREFDPSWLRVLEADGAVVGYGDIWPQDDVLDLDTAAPGCWDVFFDWAEDEARTRGIPRVRTQVPHGHTLAAAVGARGYTPWRYSLTMEIELPDAVEAPPLPDGLELRTYRDGEADLVMAMLNDAFSADPFWHAIHASNFREFYLASRGFHPELWLLAWSGEELAGAALAYSERGSDTTLGWVGTLGVRSAFRRRGLGEALLRRAFAELHARGLRRVGLGVDAENVTGALRLYERVGMRQVRRSDNWAKEV
jgi:ribosomal protein S18 acetylase RimI-like enzyme